MHSMRLERPFFTCVDCKTESFIIFKKQYPDMYKEWCLRTGRTEFEGIRNGV